MVIEEVSVNLVRQNINKKIKELGKSIKKNKNLEKKSIYFKKKGREDVDFVER